MNISSMRFNLIRSRPLTVEGTLGYMLEACRKRKEDKAWSEDMHEATTILNRCFYNNYNFSILLSSEFVGFKVTY